jgi:hypothetical protein
MQQTDNTNIESSRGIFLGGIPQNAKFPRQNFPGKITNPVLQVKKEENWGATGWVREGVDMMGRG